MAFTDGVPGIAIELLFKSIESPLPSGPAGRGQFRDLGVAPGLLRWIVVDFAAGEGYDMHHTDTVDFDLVLEGSLQMILDDGTHDLAPGDAVVMTGVDHGWNAGDSGCRMSVLSIGTPPPR
jgi:quercetin dioxygenase-like cupin family protein